MPSSPSPLPVRVFRTEDFVTVAAPMPGLHPRDISVEVTPSSRLVVDGRLCSSPMEGCGDLESGVDSDKEVLADEWSPGPYHRELALPTAVDGQAATVTYGNGILVVALPVSRDVRPAKIAVSAGQATHGPRTSSRA
jgi:HSP20 family molecular chaperone IbpA